MVFKKWRKVDGFKSFSEVKQDNVLNTRLRSYKSSFAVVDFDQCLRKSRRDIEKIIVFRDNGEERVVEVTNRIA